MSDPEKRVLTDGERLSYVIRLEGLLRELPEDQRLPFLTSKCDQYLRLYGKRTFMNRLKIWLLSK